MLYMLPQSGDTLGWCDTLSTFMNLVLKVCPEMLYCLSGFDPKQMIILCIQCICQKEINNWVQIFNTHDKTGIMPQFNRLGFCQIFNENKGESFYFQCIVPLYLHIIMKNYVFHVQYNLQNSVYNLPQNAGNCISGTLDYNFCPGEHGPAIMC